VTGKSTHRNGGRSLNGPIAVAAAALCATAVLAPADASAQAAEPWKWQASLYAYLPDIGGRTTFPQDGAGGGSTLDAETILDNLKFTFMGNLEASNGRWGMYTDVVYMDLGNSKSGYRDFTLGGSALPAGANANASYDLKGWAWTLAGTWRVTAGPASKVDVIAGARLFDMRQTFSYEVTGNVASIPASGRAGTSEAKISNWDAVVGVKGRVALGGGKWFVPYYADIGTGESKLTWQAMAGLGYSFGWGDIVAAWRYIDYDMKSGKKIESMTFNGPAIAAVFRW
jgi:hypothetical protein